MQWKTLFSPPHVIAEKTCSSFHLFNHILSCVFWQPLEAVVRLWSKMRQNKQHTPKDEVIRRMLWKEWKISDCMFRERCSVLRWVKNDDVNGALVGWWMCEELCFSRAQEVRFLTLQILPSPLISCLPCSMFDPGKNTNTYPPLWKEWEYLYLSKSWKRESRRENDSHRFKAQPWRNTPATAKTRVGDWTARACCVSIKIPLMKNS